MENVKNPSISVYPRWCCGIIAGFVFMLVISGGGLTAREPAKVIYTDSAYYVFAARSYPDPGKMLVSVEIFERPEYEPGEELSVRARAVSKNEPAGIRQPWIEHETEPGMREEIVLEAGGLAEGQYKVQVELISGENTIESASGEIYWPGRSEEFEDIRVLNNFVWELLSIEGGGISGEYEFRVPEGRRWLFVRSVSRPFDEGRVKVELESGGESTLLYEHGMSGSPVELEAMRRAGEGLQRIRVTVEGGGELDRLHVRSVPEIQHHRYPSPQHGNPGVDYDDWDWLGRHMLPHVNTVVAGYGAPPRIDGELAEWRKRGGKWIAMRSVPGEDARNDGRLFYEHFKASPGYAHPKLEGTLMDELIPRYADSHRHYAQGIRMLNEDPGLAGRGFYPYVAQNVEVEDEYFIEVLRESIAGGGMPAWESYIYARAKYSEAVNAMRRYVYRQIVPSKEEIPGMIRRSVWVFGSFSYPWLQSDGYPHVNYNAYLDKQFEMIANHPALFGLGGVSTWRTGYQDEELTRLFGKMFRHYCIEGNRGRYRDDPYMLEHIENPDFGEGMRGWSLKPAGGAEIYAEEIEDFGREILGYWQAGSDSFMVMERSGEGLSEVSQEIRGLEPGALYSVKMFSGDYGDFREGIGRRAEHPVSIEIEGGRMLEGPRYGYREAFYTRGEINGFTREEPFWLNYHWQVFRAEGPVARLRITETGEESSAEEIFCAYVEVKPYMDKQAWR